MSRGENYKSIYNQWIAFNTMRASKESHSVAEYAYEGDAFFSNGNPWQRFIDGERPFLLVKNGNHDVGFVGEGKHMDYPRIYTPCIGVFSRFPNDRMTGDELWERLRYILVCHLLELTREIIPAERADKLAAGIGAMSPIYISHTKEWYGSRIGQHYDRYSWLQKRITPDWPDLPTFYRDEAIELMQRKVEKWNTPEESRKRQRAKARKLATKIFEED